MNVWTAFILGLIIGWLVEWIIDWLFWRRRGEAGEAQLRAQFATAESERSDLRSKLSVAEQEAGDWRTRYNELVQECQARVQSLEAANAELEGQGDWRVRYDELERDYQARIQALEAANAKLEGQGEWRVRYEALERDYQARIQSLEAANAELEGRLAAVAVTAPTMIDLDPEVNVATRSAGMNLAAGELDLPEGAVVSACPQDLSSVAGIGSVYEQKLYSRGVGTYWALSQQSDETLAGIFGVKSFQGVNYDAIRADAREWAEKTDSVNRFWDGSTPDDFEILEGIGDVYEGRLYNAGICTFAVLARTSVERLAEICNAPSFRRPNYAGWIETAQRMVAQSEGR
jgi:predicted flap endonuclease-1-like 5' DNA nuclease